jgi:hypothetical protein
VRIAVLAIARAQSSRAASEIARQLIERSDGLRASTAFLSSAGRLRNQADRGKASTL